MSTAEPVDGAAAQVVRQAARDGEIDRYIAALIAPTALRDDLVALAAFAAQIGHIPDAVREPMMGEMRLQWWRDALLLGVHGEASGHPVADAVSAVRERRRLDADMLEQVVDAVAEAFAGTPAGETAWDGTQIMARFEGPLFAIAAHIHAGEPVKGCDLLFERAGVAYGLARSLCRLPFAIASGWPPLPPGIMTGETDVAGPAASVDVAAVGRLQTIARDALLEVRQRQGAAPSAAIAALTPLVMVEPYLDAQSHSMETLLVSPVEVLPLRRMWRIWRAYRRHKV